MLSVSDLRVSYGAISALGGISFKVDQGAIVTLIGGNGAGKTTTLRTISGLLRANGGRPHCTRRSTGHQLETRRKRQSTKAGNCDAVSGTLHEVLVL